MCKSITTICAAVILLISQLAFAQSSETRKPGSFSGIDVSNAFEVTLIKGNEESVLLQGSSGILSKTDVLVRNGKLIIKLQAGNYKNEGKHSATITYKNLNSIELSGAVSAKTENKLEANTLKLDLGGASSGKMEISCKSLEVELSGASKLVLSGSVQSQNIDISGASNYKSDELISDICKIEMSGASNAHVSVKNEIRGNTSGASTLKYIGEPNKVIVQTSGASSVKSSK